jgi:hypothetical protein
MGCQWRADAALMLVAVDGVDVALPFQEWASGCLCLPIPLTKRLAGAEERLPPFPAILATRMLVSRLNTVCAGPIWSRGAAIC